MNDRGCGLDTDIYGRSFMDVLNQHYVLDSSNVKYIEITTSLIKKDRVLHGVNSLIDNILAEKFGSKEILQAPGDSYIGIGCQCT